ncbi:MAG: AI-2E family transporter [Phormidesmis sp.]
MVDLLSKWPRWLVLEIVIPLTLLNGWLLYRGLQYFQELVTLLLIATLLAFLLGYPVRLLQSWGMPKGYSVMVVFVTALSLLALTGAALVPTLVPTLIHQFSEFTTRLPNWLENGQQQLEAVDDEIAQMPLSESMDLDVLATQFFEAVPGELRLLPNQLLNLALGTADNIVDGLFTAVLTLYSLLHGKDFWQGLLRWLPGEWGDRVQQAVRSQFQSYFVGQATIASLTGTLLAGVFFLFKIPFWLVFGLSVGIAGLVPFGDLLVMVAVSALVGINDPLLGAEVIVACLIVDQIIDNIFAPRILGDAVGLNPIWILLSLLVGAQLTGVVGAVIAVPLAGSIKQIIDSLEAKPAVILLGSDQNSPETPSDHDRSAAVAPI